LFRPLLPHIMQSIFRPASRRECLESTQEVVAGTVV
jgi:hypothetical protein